MTRKQIKERILSQPEFENNALPDTVLGRALKESGFTRLRKLFKEYLKAKR